ncbi:unnamed protein product [Polarella glacialis]|uniref:Glycosyltransferase 2-like domain-containing protein n=1 Tax=Polarella glacialis TaxID=89957 RepID=A0A813IYZ9_POLGL|nr:unnamed protein product [Polarella glacialis]
MHFAYTPLDKRSGNLAAALTGNLAAAAPGNPAAAVAVAAAGTETPENLAAAKVIAQHGDVLEIMSEFGCLQPPSMAEAVPLRVHDMSVPYTGSWRFTPICATAGFVLLLLGLCLAGYVLVVTAVIAAYSLAASVVFAKGAWFAWVGVRQMSRCKNADFHSLYKAQQLLEQMPAVKDDPWQEVVHFVILPNYNEDVEVLHMAIASIAQSKIAAEQVVIVLGMEMRELQAQGKADKLEQMFQGRFKHFLVAWHPEGLPGEVPGKSANTCWASRQVLREFMPKHGIKPENSIFTVADADSEFHPEYFAALTYYWLHAGTTPDNQTPLRYTTIWQPPIMHLKNYLSQPAMLRLSSMWTCLYTFSSWADSGNGGIALPYSTYSVSATLVEAVDGWDPDWISEDWHMGLKCFLATAGRLKVSPIFLPIMNYAVQGETYKQTLDARWTQAKRHALGFGEVAYYQDHLARILCCLEGDDRCTKARFLRKGAFMFRQIMLVHTLMGTIPFTTMLNLWLFVIQVRHWQLDFTVNHVTFLVFCGSQALQVLTLQCCYVSQAGSIL